MKRRIIQVIPSFQLGGAQTLVKEYLLHIAEDRFTVEALVLGKCEGNQLEQEIERQGVKITYLSELFKESSFHGPIIRRVSNSLKWRSALSAFFSERPNSIVHCHTHVMGTLLSAKKELMGSKLFYTVHSNPDKYWADGKNQKELEALRYFINNRNLTVIALDEEMVIKLRKYFGNECTIEVLNNAIDFTKFQHSEQSRRSKRSELGIPEDAYVIGHVGRFAAVKNHSFIIRVFKIVYELNPHAYLLLIGDGELKKDTEKLVKENDLTRNVLFLGERSDISELLSSFDVFLLPSLWEGFPITLIEAQAAGLRCVISDRMTEKVKLTSMVTMMKLEEDERIWAEELLRDKSEPYVEYGLQDYNITSIIPKLHALYDR